MQIFLTVKFEVQSYETIKLNGEVQTESLLR